jgi:hypothetical protein
MGVGLGAASSAAASTTSAISSSVRRIGLLRAVADARRLCSGLGGGETQSSPSAARLPQHTRAAFPPACPPRSPWWSLPYSILRPGSSPRSEPRDPTPAYGLGGRGTVPRRMSLTRNRWLY